QPRDRRLAEPGVSLRRRSDAQRAARQARLVLLIMSRWPAFVAAPVVLVAPSAHATVYLSAAQAQQAIFPGAAFTPADVMLTEAQAAAVAQRSGVRARLREQRVWRVAGGGWFIVDEVVGKHEFITYALGLNSDGSVRAIEIMDYRESYG